MGRSVLQQSKQEALLYESINTLYHAFYKHSKTLEFKSVFYHTPNPNKTKHINKKPKCHSTLATHSTPSSSPTPSSPPSPLPPTTTPPTTAVRSPAPAPPLPTPASAPFLQTLTFTRHQRSTFSRASSLDSKTRRRTSPSSLPIQTRLLFAARLSARSRAARHQRALRAQR